MRKYIFSFLTVLASGLFLAGCGKVDNGYNYADSDKYTVGDFSYSEDSIDSVQINWVAGAVYIDESVMDTLEVYETDSDKLADSDKLRYRIEDRKLVIQFCESGTDISGKSKELHVKLPILLQNVELNVVSADMEIASSATDINVDTVSGTLYLAVDQCEKLDINSVSGDAHVLLDYDMGAKIDFDSVSGKCTGDEKSADKMCMIDCDTVSGNLEVVSE